MKISFFGAGAIGSMIGGLLQRHWPEATVTLVGRGNHGQAMVAQRGVRLIGPWGNALVQLDVTSDPKSIAGSELVFLTVKSQHTIEAAESIRPHLGSATIVSIQNGINDHLIRSVIPDATLVSGMTTTNMAIQTPGEVSLQLDGVTILGPPDGGDLRAARDVVDVLGRIDCPGLDFVASKDVLGTQYNKLLINALGYASCISDSNFITEAVGNAQWRRVLGKPLIAECRRVLADSGIRVAPISGRSDISKIERLMRLLGTPVLGSLIMLAIRGRFQQQPIVFSLLQDLKRRRMTEVDHVNGEFIRLARLAETRAPISEALVSMVHEIEAAGGGEEALMTRDQVLSRIKSIEGKDR